MDHLGDTLIGMGRTGLAAAKNDLDVAVIVEVEVGFVKRLVVPPGRGLVSILDDLDDAEC